MPRQTPRRTYGKAGFKVRPSHSDRFRQSFLPPIAARIQQRGALTPTPSMKQQTLTQIDFVARPPADLDGPDLGYEEPEASPRSPKRRRLAPDEPLTPQRISLSTRRRLTSSPEVNDTVEQEEKPRINLTPKHSAPLQARASIQTAMLPPKTPQRPTRQEVPSSQSPTESLSSVHSSRGHRSVRRNHVSPLKDVSNTGNILRSRTPKRNPFRKPEPVASPNVRIKTESQIPTQLSKTQQKLLARRSALADKENRDPQPDQTQQRRRIKTENSDQDDRDDAALAMYPPDSVDLEEQLYFRAGLAGASLKSNIDIGQEAVVSVPQTWDHESRPVPSSQRPEPACSTGGAEPIEEGLLTRTVSDKTFKPPPPPPRSSSRSSKTSQQPSRTFKPAIESDTQAEAAWQPFSPSMLQDDVEEEPSDQSAGTNTEDQPELPPPRNPQVVTQQSIPPCPTSQAETVDPYNSSQRRRRVSTTTPVTSGQINVTPGASGQSDPEVIVLGSSSPTREPSQRESPAKGGGRPSWDWSPIPESQLLPESIMQFLAPGSQDSLHSEMLGEGCEEEDE